MFDFFYLSFPVPFSPFPFFLSYNARIPFIGLCLCAWIIQGCHEGSFGLWWHGVKSRDKWPVT